MRGKVEELTGVGELEHLLKTMSLTYACTCSLCRGSSRQGDAGVFILFGRLQLAN